jgi:hypothetical protein
LITPKLDSNLSLDLPVLYVKVLRKQFDTQYLLHLTGRLGGKEAWGPTHFSYTRLFLENPKKNLVFHFGGVRHAYFPQKPVVK